MSTLHTLRIRRISKKGDSLELTIDTSSEGSDSGLYIDKSYVRTENGQSYIYKDDNGKLEKTVCQNRQVALGLICGDKVRSDK